MESEFRSSTLYEEYKHATNEIERWLTGTWLGLMAEGLVPGGNGIQRNANWDLYIDEFVRLARLIVPHRTVPPDIINQFNKATCLRSIQSALYARELEERPYDDALRVSNDTHVYFTGKLRDAREALCPGGYMVQPEYVGPSSVEPGPSMAGRQMVDQGPLHDTSGFTINSNEEGVGSSSQSGAVDYSLDDISKVDA